MNLNNNSKYLIPFTLIILIGCASITGSTLQSITVAAICDSPKIVRGAVCTLVNDKGQWFVESPGKVLIQKTTGDLTVECKHLQANGVAVVQSTSNANIWGNVIAGGPIGAVLDSSTGAGFNYQPMVTVSMTGKCSD